MFARAECNEIRAYASYGKYVVPGTIAKHRAQTIIILFVRERRGVYNNNYSYLSRRLIE